MKVMKTLKTLKFWSKKKKKKKILHHSHSDSPPPIIPPCCHCHYHYHESSQTVEPSAPPLPSWLDYDDQTFNQNLLPISYQAQFDPREVDISSSSSSNVSLEPAESANVETNCSYQQYMVEDPVYGVPVLPKERSVGAIGCVFNIGAHLFRCFFPCFRIRKISNPIT